MDDFIKRMLEFEKINCTITNKMSLIYEKQTLIKNIQKEIKALNYQISELEEEKYSMWSPYGISAGKFLQKMRENMTKEQSLIFEAEFMKTLDFFEMREDEFKNKYNK